MAKIIDLNNGMFVLVDDEDYPHLSKFLWSYSKGYATRKRQSKTIKMHREILNVLKSKYPLVDHINGDGLDNRRENLRICGHSENSANQIRTNNKHGYRGVHVTNGTNPPRYRAVVCRYKKLISAGSYATILEAAKAYNKLATELYGKYAVLNKIPGDE